MPEEEDDIINELRENIKKEQEEIEKKRDDAAFLFRSRAAMGMQFHNPMMMHIVESVEDEITEKELKEVKERWRFKHIPEPTVKPKKKFNFWGLFKRKAKADRYTDINSNYSK